MTFAQLLIIVALLSAIQLLTWGVAIAFGIIAGVVLLFLISVGAFGAAWYVRKHQNDPQVKL